MNSIYEVSGVDGDTQRRRPRLGAPNLAGARTSFDSIGSSRFNSGLTSSNTLVHTQAFSDQSRQSGVLREQPRVAFFLGEQE